MNMNDPALNAAMARALTLMDHAVVDEAAPPWSDTDRVKAIRDMPMLTDTLRRTLKSLPAYQLRQRQVIRRTLRILERDLLPRLRRAKWQGDLFR